ncbi:MAG: response regulator [Candidatus Abyssobacteria bacterium SURF_17]|uniref:Response regulator n=1 Tax=Candidatus Abyssobacteria bacterium SURF_17 TaxID=2093361 RepID=A0A419F8G7_9BACT|nr:MAG: response regulator [Candidatus Abyssubacteria bacterium SURF_17]
MSTIHLLLVDDEERFLETTSKLLRRQGVEALTSTNGVDALKMLKDNRIDVVVLDVKMPGLDGGEVLRKIRQNYPLVEVIMLTGHASVESAVEGLKLGAFDYLMKPSSIEGIMAKATEAAKKKWAAEEKIRKAKIERIISHPMAVFEKEER